MQAVATPRPRVARYARGAVTVEAEQGTTPAEELESRLTDALGAPARRPSEAALGSGVRATGYWSFEPALELVVAEASPSLSDSQAIAAWRRRLGRRPVPLVLLIAVDDDRAIVVGPGGDPPPVVELDPRAVVDDIAEAARLDALDVRERLPRVWDRARGAAGLGGVRNVGLFSTHYLASRAPRLPGWDQLAVSGREAVRRRTLADRISALGFSADERAEGVYVLSTVHGPAAAVLAYPAGRDLDRAAPGGELPVAGLLREVTAAGARWGILASGDVWRLYSADHPARSTSFVEVDLAHLADPSYFAALFSAAALDPGGLASRIRDGSRDYAVGLGDRLRERIYAEVVPRIVTGIAAELERLGEPARTRVELDGVYDATLVLLYRLLFVLFAEAREYLPVAASASYRDHSLRKRLDLIVATKESGRAFDPRARDIWSDLRETFDAIAHGHTEWGVPAYDGGLFQDDPVMPAGRLLARIEPSNDRLGEALFRLAVDTESDETGRIDYSDLEIRHLGDIYEGLLQFEVDRAVEDLAYDRVRDAYVPANDGADVAVAAGGIYLRGRSGGRKASGSYYTPQIVVRHLVEEALVPVLDDHLAAVARAADAGEEEAAAGALWDFRVCDPAMGSGHFVVDALDVLTDRIAGFLAERPLRPVRAVLSQLREVVDSQARDLPAGVLSEIRDVDLLKRIVLKRCVYGVDLNPMAVELAKLGLWLDAFVPGLPLSYLDHNLRQGNSLVGVVGEEVADALRPAVATLEGDWIAERLRAATEAARAAVEAVETRLQDVEAARAAEAQRADALRDVVSVYDRWTAESFGIPGARERIGDRDTLEAAADAREAAPIAREQAFFHWPLELPEVFARERPGFDVVLANPPWEKLKVERHDFFQFRIPGLKFVSSDREREALITALIERDPQAQRDYEHAIASVARLKAYFAAAAGNYRLHGGGDPDLFKAFAERFMRLVRRGGALGCVLPRQLIGGGGTAPLRAELFARWTVLSADVLWNRRTWAFPDVFHRTRMTLLAARKLVPEGDPSIASAGPLDDRDKFARARELRTRFRLSRLREWSETLELPSLPDTQAGRVFERMLLHPRFDYDGRAWRALPYRELDAAGDKDLFNEDGRGWPVWKGNTFDRYLPDLAPPVYWAEPEPTLVRLQAKRMGSHGVFAAFDADWIADPATLPPNGCRIVFRDVVRATDRRTMKACLAPPHVFAIHTAPQLIWPRGTGTDQAFVLGVLASLPYDWLLRRRVETHLTFGIINALPIPDAGAATDRIAALAARLSCVDDRYADFAHRSGVEYGPLTAVERGEAEAEIDALVAHAYGLTEEDLNVIFGDFVDAALPAAQRDRILERFRG